MPDRSAPMTPASLISRGGVWLPSVVLLVACNGPAPTPASTLPAPPAASAPGFALLPDLSAEAAQAMGVEGGQRTVHFQDRHGESLLVLDRRDRTEDDPDFDEPVAVAVLSATLHQRTQPRQPFVQRWQREIRMPCPGLDLEAGWFTGQVGATDLDNDGDAEITLASHVFCGGGIDSQEIHITLIAADATYTIEGTSLVALEGEPPFGGERKDGEQIAAAPAAYRQHLDTVWEAVRAMPDVESEGAP